jgi:hypothetical protein
VEVAILLTPEAPRLSEDLLSKATEMERRKHFTKSPRRLEAGNGQIPGKQKHETKTAGLDRKTVADNLIGATRVLTNQQG